MTNTNLLAALKSLPAANSKAIREMPQAELENLSQATYDAQNEYERERWSYIEAAAGGKAAYDAVPWNSDARDPYIKSGTEKVESAHPEWPELKALIEAVRYPVLSRELRRRRSNAAREENAAARAAAAVPAGTYAVGEQVQVHAFGYWYNGEVVKLGRTGKVTVRYTSGTDVTREKAVDSEKVRKVSK